MSLQDYQTVMDKTPTQHQLTSKSKWRRNAVGHFAKTRRTRIRCRFRSVHAHAEQKKKSSDELDTLRRSRNSTVVVTANGEVQTNEEAQVCVHDLDPLVTVQLLEEAPAVLSLRKLCEDHGYSYEWVSGHKPRLAKEEKTIICKTDNFVPLVVPGLSTSSIRRQHLSSTRPAQERSDGSAKRRVRITTQNPKPK